MSTDPEPPVQPQPDEIKQPFHGAEEKLPHLIVRRVSANDPTSATSKRQAYTNITPYILVAIALVMTGGIVGLYFQPPGLQFLFRTLGLAPGGGTRSPIATAVPPKTKSAESSNTRTDVIGLGKLIPSGDVVVVAPPFGAGDARIASILVKEGDRVTKGDLLAIMDNEQQLRMRIDTARTSIAAKDAILAQTLTSVRLSREETRAALRRAISTAQKAQRDLDRVQKLYKDGFSTLAALDQKRTARDETAQEVERNQATLSRWDSADPARQPDVVVAQRNLDMARAEYLRAENDLDQAYVKAPVNGTVLSIEARVGERPGRAGIMNIGDIDRMTVEIEVYQTNILRVSIGDAVKLSAEALPKPLEARVSRIGLEIGRQALTDSSPAANTDARVVKVYADLDSVSSQAAHNFTNLQVTARIATTGTQ
jgi:HlyD family secretion protein